MSKPTYTLHYFDVRGRGELARLLFAAKGQKFEEKRYTEETWPAQKPKTPHGQLPYLEIDGKPYPESMAIHRYLAREFGLAGKTSLETLQTDVVLGITQDYFTHFVKAFFEKDTEKKKGIEQENADTHFPKYLGMLEKILKENGTGYYVGKDITIADLGAFDGIIDRFDEGKLAKDYPLVKANMDKVAAKLSTYLKSRKGGPL